MITLNLDEYLTKKLRAFAKENNIKLETLIETILFEYVDEVEEKQGPIEIESKEKLYYNPDYNPGDIDYLRQALGFSKSDE